MKGIICFERSQMVTSAFIARGYDFFSCDIQQTVGDYPDRHLQMDVYQALDLCDWDYVGLHPVCTKMTVSSNRHYSFGKPRYQERLQSLEYTVKLFDYVKSRFPHAYMENPVGVLNSDSRLPVPQIVHPYYFGDTFKKRTCFWFHNLPFLQIDQNNIVSPGEIKNGYPVWMYNSDKNHRSQTFPGIANALASSFFNYQNK